MCVCMVGRSGGHRLEEGSEESFGVVPSFQNSFSDALLSASHLVRAAARGLSLFLFVKKRIAFYFIFSQILVVGQEAVKLPKKVVRSWCCSLLEASSVDYDY